MPRKLCIECHSVIPTERLELLPDTETCVLHSAATPVHDNPTVVPRDLMTRLPTEKTYLTPQDEIE